MRLAANISVLLLLLFFSSIDALIDQQFKASQKPLSAAPKDICISKQHSERWRQRAIEQLWEERKRWGTTPLFVFDKFPSVQILFKNESATPTESVKHRYAWALMMWALLHGHVQPNTTVYEASSGNTARSEAYMCQLIGVEFIAVLPETTELVKVQKIEEAGGRIHKIPCRNTYKEAKELAEVDPNGFFMNQYGHSEFALDYHESGNFELSSMNLFHEILAQTKDRKIAAPTHFIHSAATGGTIPSVGRYVKRYGLQTEIILADTEFSAYYDLLASGRFLNGSENPEPLWVVPGLGVTGFGWAGPLIQGQTTSLIPEVIDRTMKIPDLASVAAMHILKRKFGIDGGPSTGINFAGVLKLVGTEMGKELNKTPSMTIATILTDSGAHYKSTYYNQSWISQKLAHYGGRVVFECWMNVLEGFLEKVAERIHFDPIELGAKYCRK